MTVSLAGAYGLYYLQDRPLLLRAGSFSAPAYPPESWEGRLASLRRDGCNAVLLAVPWTWHAPAPDRIDLSGETDPGRDLGRLLRLIEDAGLLCLLHASPPGDYPPWLPSRLPQALALGPSGRPFGGPPRSATGPVFSLLHPDLLEQLEAWYRALGASAGPFAGRPVVAWHLDGGAGGPFAGRAGELDFNPHTVERYRRYVRERYDSPRLLAREWRRAIPDFREVLPPRDRRSPGELADWQAFLEQSVAQHLERLAALARGVAPGLPVGSAALPPFVSPEAPGLVAPRVDFYGYSRPSRPAPFDASVQALRFEPYSADTRPLTAHNLAGVG
ncbi:MAG TPA: beta-galactosidase, partial [Chloroflexota bacterium]|nr:beta-galactosidase [Chloroflexota bacterium]